MTLSDPSSASMQSTAGTPAAGSHRLHVDGGLYRLLGLAQSAGDGSAQAVYQHLHPFDQGVWTRPLSEFEARFSSVSAERAAQIQALPRDALRHAITEHKARRRESEAALALALADPSRAPGAGPKLYCLGFMFSLDRSRVALIRKQTPSWQAGMLNGVGGKAEPGESLAQAMAREFAEEAGVRTEPEEWDLFARLGAPEFQVNVFRCFSSKIEECRTLTAESIEIQAIDLPALLLEGISGLGSLVCCALDADELFVRFDYRQWAQSAKGEAARLTA